MYEFEYKTHYRVLFVEKDIILNSLMSKNKWMCFFEFMMKINLSNE